MVKLHQTRLASSLNYTSPYDYFGLEVWGSIDLLGGKVVRLVKGDPTSTIVYSNNPVHVARKLSSIGLDGLHIVDIDAALGRGRNIEIIKTIIENVNIKTQVGGGIRTVEMATSLLEMGVSRIVIGTALFTNQQLIKDILGSYDSEKVVAALDYGKGGVVYKGWSLIAHMTLEEGYNMVKELSIKYVLATAVERDGTMMGPDLELLSKLSPEDRAITYASGGISTPQEVSELAKLNFKGIILGRALYEGLVPPGDLVKAARQGEVASG
ncbi:MAG: 1-(5-phosphoribosyl)-5-[(5-phosphoribosylamino)methylideneamino] imidazole-4-carboxamide isomerase [Nitrososphaerota archaeon]